MERSAPDLADVVGEGLDEEEDVEVTVTTEILDDDELADVMDMVVGVVKEALPVKEPVTLAVELPAAPALVSPVM